MSLSSWLCATNTKNMFVKIVHPGGRVELHERPILASDIMLQNPKCCVAYPHVFRQPWAVVTPDTMLLLGQTFYVVPVTNLRKRQRAYMKHSPSCSRQAPVVPQHQSEHEDDDDWDGVDSVCCFFTNKFSPKLSYGSLKQTDGESATSNATNTASRKSIEETERGGRESEESCFMCLLRGGDCGAESSMDSSESNELNKEGTKGNEKMGLEGFPKNQMENMPPSSTFDHWQPMLGRICEEHPY